MGLVSSLLRLLAISGLLITGSCIDGGELVEDSNLASETQPLQISPSALTLAINRQTQFTVSGGKPPYQFSIVSGSGTLTDSGQFTSANSPGVTTIGVTDIGGNSSFASITVVSGPSISPSSGTFNINSTEQITATGGTAPYVWFVISGGGSITQTGLFSAPAVVGTTVIRLLDAEGNKVDGTFSIVDAPFLTPAAASVIQNSDFQLVTSGGTAPYTYSIVSGSGSVNASGVFTSTSVLGNTVIRVDDSNSLSASAIVTTIALPTLVFAEGAMCATTQSQQAKCWGLNNYGVVPSIKRYYGESASDLGDNLAAVDVGAGTFTGFTNSNTDRRVCVSLSTGHAKCWGMNTSGELGINTNVSTGMTQNSMGANVNTTFAGGADTFTKVVSALTHSCAIVTGGNVKCWGQNNYGQLGINATTTLYAAGTLADLGTGRTAVDISAGDYSSCAVLDNGDVKCWGYNGFGQLGKDSVAVLGNQAGEMGDSLTAINVGEAASQVVSGIYHTCVRTVTNKVKCWGYNAYGQLGIGSNLSMGDGAGEMAALPFVDLGVGRTAVKIWAGNYRTCAELDNGEIKCWGYNNYGQLGIEHALSIGDAPGEMGNSLVSLDLNGTVSELYLSRGYHSCAILVGGSVKCWGRGNRYELGYGNQSHRGNAASSMGANLPVVDLGVGRTAVSLNTGNGKTCALLDNQQIKCWGDRYPDQGLWGVLGKGTDILGDIASESGASLPAVDLGTGRTIKFLAESGYARHTCAILDNNDTKCWGSGSNGQLGYGDYVWRGINSNQMGDNLPVIVFGGGLSAKYISTGVNMTCAILSDDSTRCWGYNGYGQLGIESVTQRNTPFAVNLGTGLTAKKVYPSAAADGGYFTCALLSDDSVKCWGRNHLGQLGKGHILSLGDGVGEMGDNLTPIDLGTGRTAKQITLGSRHTCAILDNNRIKCWGDNTYGQLGYGNTDHMGDNPGEMGDSLPYVDLGAGRTALRVTASRYSTCVLLDNSRIKCWGYNAYGQLGYEDTIQRGHTPGSTGDGLSYVNLGSNVTPVDVKGYHHHTCAFFIDGRVKCWGDNSTAQLLDGSLIRKGNAIGTMGDNLPYLNWE